MSSDIPQRNRRILLVDDQEPLHEDYRKILALEPVASPEFDLLEADFFGDETPKPKVPRYELTSVFQGADAVVAVETALAAGSPFALAFVDVRMPPGIDGIETTARIFALDPEIQVVISTAYADYAWEEIYGRFGPSDRLLFLRKPFDSTEVHQIASTLCEKWELSRQAGLRLGELETAVGVRTHELEQTIVTLESTQGRLIRSEKLASLGRIVAGLAHEINTPVGAIVSSCDSANRALDILLGHIRSADTDPRSEKAVDTLVRAQATITTASRRMAELVDSLGRFAHLDRAERQWLDVRDSVATVITLLTHELGNRIEVVTEFGEVPSISCHPGEIHQLLLGLLENAIAAIDDKGTIVVRVRGDQGGIEIEVEDDGRGITEERMEALFDVGLTAKGSRIQIDWGLASLLQIARDHGGEIRAESEPGKGSRFWVTLPTAGGSADSPPGARENSA